MFSPTGYFAILTDDESWDEARHVSPLTDYQILPVVGWNAEHRALVAEEAQGDRVVLADYVDELGWKSCRVLPTVPWITA